MNREKRQKLFSLSVMIFAAMGGILYGYDLGIISGAMLFIRKDIPMSVTEFSWLVGAVFGGGSIATLVTGPLADAFGRRRMIMLSSFVFIIGVLIVYFGDNYWAILAGRLVQGLGVGIITIAVPLYLSECVPHTLRGVGVSVFQLLLTAGILLAALTGLYYTPTGDWRGMFLTAVVPGLVMFFGCFLLSDSPRWLMMKGRDAKAKLVLERFSTKEEVAQVFGRMKRMRDKHIQQGEKSESLFQRHFLKPLIIAIALAALNQLIGVNVLLQLSAFLLKSSGLGSNVVAMVGGTAITGLNFIVTLIAIFFVDKLPRNVMYGIGTAGLTIALVYCGFVLKFVPVSPSQGYLLLGGILGFILFYAMGPGILIWVALGEVLPNRIRSNGMAVALCLNSFVSFGFAGLFVKLSDALGNYTVFWICGGFGLLYFLIVSFALPKTRGKTLEEIEAQFEGDK